jgi:hypothetical protein
VRRRSWLDGPAGDLLAAGALFASAAALRWACVRRAGAARRSTIAIATMVPVAACLLHPRGRSWRGRWGGTRTLGFVAAVTLVWPIVTAPRGPTTRPTTPGARWALLVLGFGVLATPVAIPPLLVLVWREIDARREPIGMWAWADVMAPFHLLVVVAAACLVRPLAPRVARWVLPVAAAIHASSYVHSALDKIRLGWLADEDPGRLFANAWVNGHRSDLDEASMVRIATKLGRLRKALVVVALATELSATGLLASRRTGMAISLLLASFHLGVQALSGIWFWPWVAVDLALFAAFFQDDSMDATSTATRLAIAAGVIGASPWLLPPARLAWLDTPLVETFVFRGEDRDGAVRVLPREAFAPYDGHFTQGRFAFLVDTPLVVDSFGETRDPDVLRALCRGLDAVDDVTRRHGVLHHDEARAARLDALVRDLFSSARLQEGAKWEKLAPPSTTLLDPRGALRDLGPLRRVHVVHLRTYFDGARVHRLEERVLRTIELDPA